MTDKLLYRRQFLLANEPVDVLNHWNCYRINNFYLYGHPDLSLVINNGLALIGNIFDYEHPEKDNSAILYDIDCITGDRSELFFTMKKYAGCYVLLHTKNSEPIIFHDARGTREIYYCTQENLIVCGSQPNLIAALSNPKLKKTSNPQLLDFYYNFVEDSQWVGDETIYDGIKHLLPNHYLNLSTKNVHRYWPDKTLKKMSLEESVQKSCSYLHGVMEAIVNRQPVMMAITAGNDSRILLAAAKKHLRDIFFFVNDEGIGPENPDIKIPVDIFNHIKVPFAIHNVENTVDPAFNDAFLKSTLLAEKTRVSYIYNVFYRNYSEKLLILGVSEIARIFFGHEPKKLSHYRLASKLGNQNSAYALAQCNNMKKNLEADAKKYGINVMTLFYWEQRLGNWGASKNTESLIAIEKVDPFNSHFLYETLLSTDEKYRSVDQTVCILFRELIRKMWPELLKWPINPTTTVTGKVKQITKNIGAFKLLKEIKYIYNYVRDLLFCYLMKSA